MGGHGSSRQAYPQLFMNFLKGDPQRLQAGAKDVGQLFGPDHDYSLVPVDLEAKPPLKLLPQQGEELENATRYYTARAMSLTGHIVNYYADAHPPANRGDVDDSPEQKKLDDPVGMATASSYGPPGLYDRP